MNEITVPQTFANDFVWLRYIDHVVSCKMLYNKKIEQQLIQTNIAVYPTNTFNWIELNNNFLKLASMHSIISLKMW